MIVKSYYGEYVDKYFGGLVTSVITKLNEKRQNALPYLYRDMLDLAYSADGTWRSILGDYTRVSADVVALDSTLPLKTRDAIEHAHGEIPKLGMKMYLTEKQMKDLDNMISQNLPLNVVVPQIFLDTPRCIDGVYERIEDMFLSELSTGVGLSERSTGTGVRVDVGYKAENQFLALTKAWKDSTGKYEEEIDMISDIEQIMDKAMEDQNIPTHAYCDDNALRAMYRNKYFRQQFAFNQNFVGTAVPVLDFEKVKAIFASKWGVELHRVNRVIKTELNGSRVNHRPWADGRIVFTCSDRVGNLVWTTCAEMSRPVADVSYQTVDDFMLVSRYADNDPLREYTSSQAMVVPIIQNVDQIYTLDTTKTKG